LGNLKGLETAGPLPEYQFQDSLLAENTGLSQLPSMPASFFRPYQAAILPEKTGLFQGGVLWHNQSRLENIPPGDRRSGGNGLRGCPERASRATGP